MDILELDSDLLPLGATPLHLAVHNSTKAVSMLLESYSKQDPAIDQPDSHGRTPLCVALQNARFEAARLLIEAGANLDAQFIGKDKTISEVLVECSYHSFVTTLIWKNVKLKLDPEYLRVLLHSAAYEGNDELLQRILDTYEVEVDNVDHMTRTPLHYASQMGRVTSVEVLLRHGATVTSQDSGGSTPLHLACACGHMTIVELLLQDWACPSPGVVLNSPDSRSCSCAHVALYQRQFKVLEYLLEHFRSSLDLKRVDRNGHSLPGLLFYCRFMLNILPHATPVTLPYLSAEEATWVLHSATYEGDLQTVLHSLPMANVNAFDFTQHTPLILASMLGYVEICKALIEGGADPNMADEVGRSPLHWACENNHLKVIAYLLSLCTINPTLFFDSYSRPLSSELLELLLEYFANNVAAVRPAHWQKWLSLAARNPRITQTEFSRLVNRICPQDWAKALAQTKYEYIPTTHKDDPRSYLSPYVEEESSADIKNYQVIQAQLIQLRPYKTFKKIRKDYTPFKCMKCPPLLKAFKKIPTQKDVPDKYQSHSQKTTFYPLHEAALSGNRAVFDFILDEVKYSSVSLLRSVLIDIKDDCGQSVIELMARKFAIFENRFNSSLIEDIKERFSFSLPKSLKYEVALFHYLIVSSSPSAVKHTLRKEERSKYIPSRTPLDKWPRWYSNLMFCLFMRDFGPPMAGSMSMTEPALLSEEERKKLARRILESFKMPDEEIFAKIGYCSLLGAAVKHKCLWAVELLTEFGTSSNCNVDKRLLLSEAAKTCQIEMIDHLLVDADSPLTFSRHQEALCSALLVLAANDHMATVEKLYYSIVRKSSFLWTTRFGPRLIYLSLSHKSDSLTSALIEDMIAVLSHSILISDSTHDQAKLFKMMRLFRSTAFMYRSPFQQARLKELHLSLELVAFILQHGTTFFHLLCGAGKYDLVDFVMKNTNASDLKEIIMKLDSGTMSSLLLNHSHRVYGTSSSIDRILKTKLEEFHTKLGSGKSSPLFYAVVGGHLDIVELLISQGCPLMHPSPEAFPELLAVILHLTLSSSCWKERRHLVRDFMPHNAFFDVNCSIMLPAGVSISHHSTTDLVEFFNSRGDFSQFISSDFFLGIMQVTSRLPSLTPVETILSSIDNISNSAESWSRDIDILSYITATIITFLPSISASSTNSLKSFDSVVSKLIVSEAKLEFTNKMLELASQKGLWKVVQKLVPMSFQKQSFGETYACILSNAVKQQRDEVAVAICNALSSNGILGSEHLMKPLCMAVTCCNADMVRYFLGFKVKIYTLLPLSKALRCHHNHITSIILDFITATDHEIPASEFSIILTTATRYNDSYCIEQLLTKCLDKVSSNLPPLSSKKASFWVTVLTEAAKHGHEMLALQAIACLPESQLKRLEGHDFYLDILSWCCYWGMGNVLECLYIPSTSTFLKSSYKSHCSPWMCAAANGNIGKLSSIDSFPSLENALRAHVAEPSLKWNLLHGAFHKALSRNPRNQVFHNFNHYPSFKKYPSFLKILIEAVYFGLAETLETYIEYLGKLAGECIVYFAQHFNLKCNLLSIACSQRNNLVVIELLLKCLFDSSNISNLDLTEDFAKIVKLGEVAYAQSFIRTMPDIFSKAKKSHSLLNFAVQSDNPKMVNYILDLLDERSPDECFRIDDHYQYPLFSAFALGCSHVISQSSLLETASKSGKFKEQLHPDWRHSACKINGWFNLLMETHSSMVASDSSSDKPIHAIMSLRNDIPTSPALKVISLLQLSMHHQAFSVTEAVLQASGGIFDLNFPREKMASLVEILINPTVQEFMRVHSYYENYYIQYIQAYEEKAVLQVLAKFNKSRGCEDSLIQLLTLFQPHYNSDVYTNTLLSACHFGKIKVLGYLLDDCVLSKEDWEKCLSSAIENGHTEIAADMKLKLPADFGISVGYNPLYDLIFSGASYSKILDSFFSSISDPQQRLPLASSWIAHDWSEKEAQLVVRQISLSTYAPPNPWFFSINSADVTITVDWDSFSECLLTSPCIMDLPESKFRHTPPLMVEAVVFSMAVLGQIVASADLKKPFHNPKTDSPSLFGSCGVANQISSLVVSCVVSPTPPSFSSFSDMQGMLTVSYQANEKTFTFPSILPKKLGEDSVPSAGDIETPVPDTSHESVVARYSSRFQDLCKHYEKTLKEVTIQKICSVSISFSDSVFDTNDHTTLETYGLVASIYLQDIVDALKLISRPFWGHPGTQGYPDTFVALSVDFDLESNKKDFPSAMTVSLEHSVLSITGLLPDRLETSEYCNQFSYSDLVSDLTSCIFKAEMDVVQNQTEDKIGRKVAVILKSSLKIVSVTPDILKLGIENDDGEVVQISKFDFESPQNFLYLRSLRNLKSFLQQFCDSLKVFLFKPRLRANVSSLFEAGFQTVLTKSAVSEFYVKAGIPHLAVSVHQLLSGSINNSLLHLFQSVLMSSDKRQSPSAIQGFPPPVLAAPFASYVAFDESNGLLYPVKGAMGTITVQLVDYRGKLIEDTFSVNCCLEIEIKHLMSVSAITASSSHNPSPRSATKQLLVKEGANGTFKVEWTPQRHGLHSVSLCINSTPIRGSPYKCIASSSNEVASAVSNLGLRQATTNDPFIFLVSHSREPECGEFACDVMKPPSVHLYNKKSIKLSSATPSNSDSTSGSQEDFVKRFVNEKGPTHHISMSSAYGGASKWYHIPSACISIHLSQEKDEKFNYGSHFRLTVTPLGSGLYRVALSCTTTGLFSVFASCAHCQSSLTILWKGERTFHPTSLFIVPGSLSPTCSTLEVVQPTKFTLQKKDKKNGVLCEIKAGEFLHLRLKARDQYYNEHTTGGAVKSIIIQGGGKRTPNLEAEDISGDVSYVDSGEYAMKVQLFATGTHNIMVTNSRLESFVLGKVKVTSGMPHGGCCKLSDFNSYEATLDTRHCISVELFDQFNNPTHYNDDFMVIRITEASIGDHVLNAYTGPHAFNLGYTTSRSTRFIIFTFTPRKVGQSLLQISINHTPLPDCPLPFNVRISMQTLKEKLHRLKDYLQGRHSIGYTHTLTIDRQRLLESAVEVLQEHHFSKIIRVRFGDEIGLDVGGISREFFHLLSLEFVNPNFALFQSMNGLYKPSPHSSANENHLFYFKFFGKILAKTICEGHQIPVRFTPSVYKYLLDQKCVLDDLKLEEPTLYMGLIDIMTCETDEELESMAPNFTATTSHFGLVQEVELGQGGEERKVTLENRKEFIYKLYNWYLTGCITKQLESLFHGFTSLIPRDKIHMFKPLELEVILSGQPSIDISFIRKRTKYQGYTNDSEQVKWLWRVITDFSQEERCRFLQFCTGCGCLPIREVENWEFRVQRGSNNCSLLPEASTCFNALKLPVYNSLAQLKTKLHLAIQCGNQGFLQH